MEDPQDDVGDDVPSDLPQNYMNRKVGFIARIFNIVDYPVSLFREKFVEPMTGRNKYYYYHRKFRRVPNIDECEHDDAVCVYEADQQYRRDKLVDNNILRILNDRLTECIVWHGPDSGKRCKKIQRDWEQSSAHWFAKYGDLGATGRVQDAYMKQKHRLIWERRNNRRLYDMDAPGGRL